MVSLEVGINSLCWEFAALQVKYFCAYCLYEY